MDDREILTTKNVDFLPLQAASSRITNLRLQKVGHLMSLRLLSRKSCSQTALANNVKQNTRDFTTNLK